MNDAEIKRVSSQVRSAIEDSKLCRDEKDYDGAIDELERAVRIIERSGWSQTPEDGMADGENQMASHLADCYGMIGGNLRRLNRLSEALEYFDRGREYEEDERYGLNSSYNMVNAITLPIEIGSKTATEQRSALLRAAEALKFQTTKGKRRRDRWAFADLGQCLLLLGDLNEARAAYKEFNDLADGESVLSHLNVLARLCKSLQLSDPTVSTTIQEGLALLRS